MPRIDSLIDLLNLVFSGGLGIGGTKLKKHTGFAGTALLE